MPKKRIETMKVESRDTVEVTYFYSDRSSSTLTIEPWATNEDGLSSFVRIESEDNAIIYFPTEAAEAMANAILKVAKSMEQDNE